MLGLLGFDLEVCAVGGLPLRRDLFFGTDSRGFFSSEGLLFLRELVPGVDLLSGVGLIFVGATLL